MTRINEAPREVRVHLVPATDWAPVGNHRESPNSTREPRVLDRRASHWSMARAIAVSAVGSSSGTPSSDFGNPRLSVAALAGMDIQVSR